MSSSLGEVTKVLEEQPHLAQRAISESKTSSDIEQVRVRFLGKKSILSETLSRMKEFTPDQKKEVGRIATQVRTELETLIQSSKEKFEVAELDAELMSEQIDTSLPGFFTSRSSASSEACLS